VTGHGTGRSLPAVSRVAAASVIIVAIVCSGTNATTIGELLERPYLSDDWGGLRGDLDERGLNLEAVYTGDVFANVDGGVRRKAEYLDNLDLTLTCRTQELTGVDAGTIFLYGLSDQGGNPSSNVGDAQGVDNIEAPDAIKLYEAWWQKTMLSDKLSILIGLYDLNSEFDVVETAALFINSSFGIGAAFGHSGLNGPSIFPTTSLGARLKTEIVPRLVVQTAVLDGVPGDPDHPSRTEVKVRDGDGVLVATEIAYTWAHEEDNAAAEGSHMARRQRRRRIGRGWGTLPYTLKLALGTWLYTTRLPVLDEVDAQGNPVERRGHPGVYLLADYDVTGQGPFIARGLSLFADIGLADGDVEQFAGYAGGGFVYTGLIPARPADRMGFGVAAARNSDAFKRAKSAAGFDVADFEIALEWTYHASLAPWLAIQPDVQYVIHPSAATGMASGSARLDNALVLGLRYEVSF
jgi:porin